MGHPFVQRKPKAMMTALLEALPIGQRFISAKRPSAAMSEEKRLFSQASLKRFNIKTYRQLQVKPHFV